MIAESATFAIAAAAEPGPEDEPQQPPVSENPDLAFYRDHTLVLLRRYFRLSIETGRLPSLLGRELFRARASQYHLVNFEDAVIFVHDVEHCLAQLDRVSQELIARIVFQEYTEEELADRRKWHRQRIVEGFVKALDRVTEIFLATGILRPLIRPD